MRYLLNSAVITSPGLYEYKHIDLDQAREWLRSGEYESCIRYLETAQALAELSGLNIPISRKIITMQTGDEALVFRLVFPKGYRPDPNQKGRLGVDFIRKHCEIGILKKLK